MATTTSRSGPLARVDKLKAVREEASAALQGYAWVDKAKGTVRVPIQRAMELTVAELAQKKPVPANPIAPEVPPVPSAAPAASPAGSSIAGAEKAMSFSDLIARMKQFDKNGEVIFDREEPIGMATDLVMPRRRWFRKKSPPRRIGHISPIGPIQS